jgi:hypothetical protein
MSLGALGEYRYSLIGSLRPDKNDGRVLKDRRIMFHADTYMQLPASA